MSKGGSTMRMISWMRIAGLVVAVGLLLSLASNHAPEQASASAASLPSVSSGARPGPDVLYAPAPAAPQLENRNPRFNASPLLVSGTEAYVNGEYLYQDYLYDDYGSNTDGSGGTPLSPRAGDINYPTNNARYGGNAADLVEFRIDVAPDSVAYRPTLKTLLEADSTLVTIALDTARHPTPAGIFNLAFRFNEPVRSSDTPPDTNQSTAIRNKQPTQYAHDIDFAALDAGTNSSTVPSSGVQIRIFPSRLQLGEGQDINAYPA